MTKAVGQILRNDNLSLCRFHPFVFRPLSALPVPLALRSSTVWSEAGSEVEGSLPALSFVEVSKGLCWGSYLAPTLRGGGYPREECFG